MRGFDFILIQASRISNSYIYIFFFWKEKQFFSVPQVHFYYLSYAPVSNFWNMIVLEDLNSQIRKSENPI